MEEGGECLERRVKKREVNTGRDFREGSREFQRRMVEGKRFREGLSR